MSVQKPREWGTLAQRQDPPGSTLTICVTLGKITSFILTFICLFMPSVNWSFDRKLLNTYYVLGTVVGAGGTRIPEQTQPPAGKRHRAKSSTNDNAVTVLVWVAREKQREQEE